jgi:hypothetical protein
LRDTLAVAAVVIDKETLDGGRLGALPRFQTGPALQKSADLVEPTSNQGSAWGKYIFRCAGIRWE